MSEEERAVFLKLSVFRGGFEREAAQKIADASLRTLTNLVNKSLLSRDPNGRYFVQKTLLQYASERFVGSQVEAATRNAHCLYFAEFASKFAEPLNSPKEQAAVEALDIEQENLRVAWQHGLTHGDYHLLDIMQETLHYYYLAHSWLREGYDLFKEFSDTMAQAGFKDSTYWRARIRQAWAGTRFGKHDEALAIATAAIQFFGENSHSTEVAHALNQISYVYMLRGDYEQAKAYARQSVAGIEADDDLVAYYMGMGNLGYAHYLAGEFQQARTINEELNESEQAEHYSPTGNAYNKNNLGEVLRDMGELKRAKALFEESYAIFESINNKRGMAFTILNLAGVYFVQGDFAQAKTMDLRSAAQYTGEFELAKSKYEESLRIRRTLGDKRGIADSLSDLAGNYVNLKQYDKAYQFIDEALALRVEIGDRQGEASALAGRGMGMLMMGHLDEARRDLERARAIGDEIGDLWTRAQSYAGLGELASVDGRLDESLRYFKQVLALGGNDAPLPIVMFVLTGIASIYIKQQQYQAALELLTLVLRYPVHYIVMAEDRAKKMLHELSAKVDKQFLEVVTQQSKSIELKQVIAVLLEEG
jgi:tetratricopeptide (TPR) repeat protein